MRVTQVVVLLFVASIAATASAVPSDASAESEARRAFDEGVRDVERKAWDDALARFRRSFKLRPSRSAEANVAVSLTRLGRFDEALDTYEDLLQRFSNVMPPPERAAAETERARLERFTGGIVVDSDPPGAELAVDGRARGTAMGTRARVAVGTRVVRVTKAGYAPFETTVRVASGETSRPLHAQLLIVTRLGRLRVVEALGRAFEVRIDGAAVGTTPWEGEVSSGEHAVALRGKDDTGTPPEAVSVEAGDTASLALRAGPLPAELHIEPTPADARVLIDGTAVSTGAWAGVQPSGRHVIDVENDWHETARLPVDLSSEQPTTLRPSLERVRRTYVEAFGGVTLPPLYAVTGADDCSAGCTGQLSGVRGGYLLARSLGLEIFLVASMTNRRDAVNAYADVNLSFGGISAKVQLLDRTPITLRLAAGIGPGVATVSGVLGSTSFLSPVAGPEVRWGYRFNRVLMTDVGVAAYFFFVPSVAASPFYSGARSPGLEGGIGVAFPLSVAAHFDF